jgi:hypothetical protein
MRDSQPANEAQRHIDQCVYDISDPHASPKRKRRARAWLEYWATELERIATVSD